MAEVIQDGSGCRLEAYYQPDQCIWTLAILPLKNGKIAPDAPTYILGEGDPGVCIPPKRPAASGRPLAHARQERIPQCGAEGWALSEKVI